MHLVKFCSDVFRTGANISYFAFVFSRYIAVTKRNIQTRLNKFNTKFNSILFILITLVISVSINVYIIFDFEIILSILGNQLQSISMKKFSSYRMESIDDYKENFSSSSVFILMNVAFYAKMIFSDLAHIVASTIVDVFLFKFVKQKMNLKINLMSANNLVANINQISNIRKFKKTKCTEKRISNMIILNWINFAVLRLPLAVLNFYGFVFRFDKETNTNSPSLFDHIVCKKLRFCASLSEIFLCFYSFSFFIQFLIFNKLDTNFKLSISDIKKKMFLPQKQKLKMPQLYFNLACSLNRNKSQCNIICFNF